MNLKEIITRRVWVDTMRSPKQVLDATGRTQYIDNDVVMSMPHGKGGEMEVFFSRVDRPMTDDELKIEYEPQGFVPADTYSLGAVNEADRAFAARFPNFTHWKNAKGRWCFFSCFCQSGGYGASTYRSGNKWSSGWWIALIRK